MQSQAIAGTPYQFSATRVEELGSSEWTLASVVVDASGSTYHFTPQMEKAIQEIVGACALHPRADSMMIRVVSFSNNVTEVHGFIPVAQIDTAQYIGCLKGGGNTALYDATYTATQATIAFGKTLGENDFEVNGITFVITDGADNASRVATPDMVKKAMTDVIQMEQMNSHQSILIGVNDTDAGLSQYLNTVKTSCGFNEYVSLGNVTAAGLAKLGKFVSKSVSVASVSLAQGVAPTHSLTF